MALKLISLNIEGKRHLDKVVPFLTEQKADVVCLQEVFEEDLPKLKDQFYSNHLFLPTWRTSQHFNLEIKEGYSPGNQLFGLAMFSRLPLTELQAVRLDPKLPETPENTGPGTWNPGLLVARAENFTIANTHFTWTPKGKVNDRQRRHLQTLFGLLKPYPNLVLIGDFNSPRGGEIHQALTQKFVDHTPKNITSTLDPKLHYANRLQPGKLKLVVDYLFTTPGISAKVTVKNNLSDHLALVARVYKSADYLPKL